MYIYMCKVRALKPNTRAIHKYSIYAPIQPSSRPAVHPSNRPPTIHPLIYIHIYTHIYTHLHILGLCESGQDERRGGEGEERNKAPGYRCKCGENYTGRHCEEERDFCAIVPCINQGREGQGGDCLFYLYTQHPGCGVAGSG